MSKSSVFFMSVDWTCIYDLRFWIKIIAHYSIALSGMKSEWCLWQWYSSIIIIHLDLTYKALGVPSILSLRRTWNWIMASTVFMNCLLIYFIRSLKRLHFTLRLIEVVYRIETQRISTLNEMLWKRRFDALIYTRGVLVFHSVHLFSYQFFQPP